MSQPPGFNATIDVCSIPPRELHPLVFATVDALAAGERLLLINDHDQKPLFYQFSFSLKPIANLPGIIWKTGRKSGWYRSAIHRRWPVRTVASRD